MIILSGISQSIFSLINSLDREAFQKARERNNLRTKKVK